MNLRSVWNGSKWMAGALFWPFSFKKGGLITTLKKLSVFTLAWGVLQPASTMLFPRAETVLKEEGLSPDIAQELAPGKKVYVRTDNLIGTAHALFDATPFGAPWIYWQHLTNNNDTAYATHSVSPFFNNVSAVYIRKDVPDRADIQEMQAVIRRISQGRTELALLISARDQYEMRLLHEIRHCSEENQKIEAGVRHEGDADYHAIRALARARNKPSLQDAFLIYAAAYGSVDSKHNTALYLDNRFLNMPMPTKESFDYANEVSTDVNTRVLMKKVGAIISGNSTQMQQITPTAPSDMRQTETFSLAVRRVNLFASSWDKLLIPKQKPLALQQKP